MLYDNVSFTYLKKMMLIYIGEIHGKIKLYQTKSINTKNIIIY